MKRSFRLSNGAGGPKTFLLGFQDGPIRSSKQYLNGPSAFQMEHVRAKTFSLGVQDGPKAHLTQKQSIGHRGEHKSV